MVICQQFVSTLLVHCKVYKQVPQTLPNDTADSIIYTRLHTYLLKYAERTNDGLVLKYSLSHL